MLSLSLLCSSISGTRNKEHEAGVNTLALSETSDTKLFVVLVIISEGTATRQLQTCLGHIRLLLPNFFRTAPVEKASLTQLLNKFLQDALDCQCFHMLPSSAYTDCLVSGAVTFPQ